MPLAVRNNPVTSFAGAGKRACDMPPLNRQHFLRIVSRTKRIAPEDLRLLKEVEAVIKPLVFRNSLDQIGQERGADVPVLRRRRRGQRQHTLVAAQHGIHDRRIHPRIGEYFLHIAPECQILLYAPQKVLVQLIDGAGKRRDDGRRLKVLVAVHPRDLFHDVRLDGHIARGTPGRHRQVHGIPLKADRKAQQLQLGGNLAVRDALAQPALQPRQRYIQLFALRLAEIPVGESDHAHLRELLCQQLHGQCKRHVAPLRINSLLVAGGRLGAVVVAQCRAAHPGWTQSSPPPGLPGWCPAGRNPCRRP